MKLNQDKTAME